MKSYLIAGILIAGAAAASMLLPDTLLRWQDEKQVGRAEVKEAEEVILTEQASMTFSQKLELLKGNTVNTLTLVNGKNYTQETIGAKVKEEAGKLAELGILPDLNAEEMIFPGSEINFFMDMEDSERSMMLWTGVAYAGDYQLDYLLDDESGKLLGFRQSGIEAGGVSYAGAKAGAALGGDEMIEAETKVEENFSLSEEDLTKLAERWAEYLGCRLLEISRFNPDSFSEEDKKLIEKEMQKYREKGMNEKEAYMMALESLGYSYGSSYWDYTLYATFQDEAGTIKYTIRSNEKNIYFYSLNF